MLLLENWRRRYRCHWKRIYSMSGVGLVQEVSLAVMLVKRPAERSMALWAANTVQKTSLGFWKLEEKLAKSKSLNLESSIQYIYIYTHTPVCTRAQLCACVLSCCYFMSELQMNMWFDIFSNVLDHFSAIIMLVEISKTVQLRILISGLFQCYAGNT